ncbi:hypothetical protein EDC01DRAFT_630723 [Geopyxis carbonaria]|nr:hypothetical protein EDC01DRAFT_630723 [Geopyxis carbonaria]
MQGHDMKNEDKQTSKETATPSEYILGSTTDRVVEMAQEHSPLSITTQGATKIDASMDDRSSRELTLPRQTSISATPELSSVKTNTERPNSNLKDIKDQAEVMKNKVIRLHKTHSLLCSEVRTVKQDKNALLNNMEELRAENAEVVRDTFRNKEYRRRLHAIHQAQLGSRWQENRLFEQRRQAQETQLSNREQAVAAAEAQLTSKQEAIAAAQARLVALRTAWERTSSYRHELVHDSEIKDGTHGGEEKA